MHEAVELAKPPPDASARLHAAMVLTNYVLSRRRRGSTVQGVAQRLVRRASMGIMRRAESEVVEIQ